MEVYNSQIEQKNCLPSRDRTAGLKITNERDVLQQLQSCALPAELRRVNERSCSRDESLVSLLIYKAGNV